METSLSDTCMPVGSHQGTDLFLSGLKDITAMQEERLHLVNTAWSDENEVENRKKSQLKRKTAVSDLPEGESTEKGSEDMQEDFVPHVVLEERQLLRIYFTYNHSSVLGSAKCEY